MYVPKASLLAPAIMYGEEAPGINISSLYTSMVKGSDPLNAIHSIRMVVVSVKFGSATSCPHISYTKHSFPNGGPPTGSTMWFT